ncbi:MAG: hypothetical protein K2J72_12040 [Oscillospiraceae bacterium]|nr:hypothetical protein [Oscillospiraceae bacterium]
MFNATKSNEEKTTEETKKQKRCFVMMPFSDPDGYDKGHFRKIYEQIIKPAIEKAGYIAYRVDENGVSDLITTKIFQAILDCDMAICDLSSRNPNVLYELGIRHAFDKPVVLINDDKTERIFDIQGLSTITYRSSRLYDEVPEDQKKITEAIKANENNSSSYSIINMVKLQKATYDKDNKDVNSPELNNALLMRVIAALDKTEQNQANVYSKLRNEQEQEQYRISSDILQIDNSLNKLTAVIEEAIYTNTRINTNEIKCEINNIQNMIDKLLKSSFINKKQREQVRHQQLDLDKLLSDYNYLNENMK